MNRPTNTFAYPWEGLENYLDSRGLREIALLAFGSLMNRSSAQVTFPFAKKAVFTPAIGYGIRRVFDYRLPVESFARHGNPASSRHVAALNVKYTGNEDDSVNGIVLRVPVSEIGLLRQREIDYDLTRVDAKNWDSETPIEEPVFVLECKSCDKEILPHLNYLKICEDGANSVSSAFLDFFRATTFLADQSCLLDWNGKPND